MQDAARNNCHADPHGGVETFNEASMPIGTDRSVSGLQIPKWWRVDASCDKNGEIVALPAIASLRAPSLLDLVRSCHSMMRSLSQGRLDLRQLAPTQPVGVSRHLNLVTIGID